MPQKLPSGASEGMGEWIAIVVPMRWELLGYLGLCNSRDG